MPIDSREPCSEISWRSPPEPAAVAAGLDDALIGFVACTASELGCALWVPGTRFKSCHLLILVYEAAEPVDPLDASCVGLSVLGKSA
jgi:hypothetical protein